MKWVEQGFSPAFTHQPRMTPLAAEGRQTGDDSELNSILANANRVPRR
jgi:hypothetical protein